MRGGESPGAGAYVDVPGFCKSAKLEDVRGHGHVLTPGRYVGAAEADEDEVPFEERVQTLSTKLREQFKEADRLMVAIEQALDRIVTNE